MPFHSLRKRSRNAFGTSEEELGTMFKNNLRGIITCQEKMRGQRGRLPVQPSGYVMSTKVIFRRAEVFVLAEVCLPRRPHVGQPRSDASLSVPSFSLGRTKRIINDSQSHVNVWISLDHSFFSNMGAFILCPQVPIIYASIIAVNVFAYTMSFSQSTSLKRLPWVVHQAKHWFYLEKPLPNKTAFLYRWCSSSVRLN